MQPIVNGIEAEYNEEVEFMRINAGTADGLKTFNAYGMFGHPAYLILDESGKVLWQNVGEQPKERIEENLIMFMEN